MLFQSVLCCRSADIRGTPPQRKDRVPVAKEVIIRLRRDDLDGSEATKTVVFAWAGTTYEINLSDDSVERFSAVIAPYVGAARKSSARGRRRVAESIVEAYDDAQAALAKTGVAPRGLVPRKSPPPGRQHPNAVASLNQSSRPTTTPRSRSPRPAPHLVRPRPRRHGSHPLGSILREATSGSRS